MKKIYKRILSAFLAAALMAGASPISFAADGAQFEVKPYLLAPKTDGMTIAWEADTATEATIAIGTEETQLDSAVSVPADADAPLFNGEQMQFYSYEATGLQPDTQYYYEVKLGEDVSCKGSFRTLPEDPDEVKLMFVTDTHKFETAEQFDRFVYSFNPDVIIHTGDIPEGTGTQKEQFSYWFDSGDFIQNYPVVYCPGNHDYGEFYDEYFGKLQAKAYSSSENGDNYSFDIGNVHIIMMDSNPWGLMQMNIETAGGTIGADLQATIDSALSWLEQDLQSADAQNAAFRIIGMHHPYGDSFTKRYIPDLIEKYNVDLFLGGHSHSYSMNVSANPAVGAGTVYINGQDARSSSASGDWGTIVIADGLLTFTNYGAGLANQQYVLATEKQQLAFSDISIEPAEILSNGSVNITATVTNEGKGLAAAALPVYDNGTLRYVYALASKAGGSTSTVLLQAGESKTLYGTLSLSELGEHTLQLADYTASVNVSFREASYEVSNLRVKLGDAEISDVESDRLHLKADITNIGNEGGIATAEFTIDDEVMASQQYQVGAGETATAEFSYDFDKAGTYTVAIRVGEAVVSKKVTIEGSIQGMPVVYDKSGNGNDAYIHGTPTLSQDDDGNTALVLNEGVTAGSMAGGKDYIEVPDDGSIRIESGVTGMVWAKWLHAPSNATFDHYPLLVKGPSISQGVNYQYRMAIRKTGKLTYGIGFDNENGEFFWNDDDAEAYGAKTGEWVVYSGAFDRETGGVSYEDSTVSGRIDPPDYEAEITNWEGSPLLVGVSHFYTLRPNRNRGAYNTTLSAEVSQIRYYDASVGQEEIEGLVDDPSAEGASGDHLLVWLDFNDIDQQGSHTTEWRAVNDVQALQYTAEIGGNAAIQATVQVSNDQSTIVDEKTITLADGTNTVDLSDLADGAYVRIVTAFTSDLNETESFVPVLREYVIATADGEQRWNTAASFKEGMFEGAAAHQSEDFYAIGVSDFDDYSGMASEPYEPGSSGGSSSGSSSGGSVYGQPSASVSGAGGKVAAGNDGTVAITPDDGYRIAKITVNGKEVAIPENGKLTGLSKTDRVVVTFEKIAVTLPFADVADDAWYADAVQYVYENGMMNGTSATMFQPDATTTRGMIVTMLYRLEGEPSADASAFTDVAADAWYADAVGWAAANGVVNGVSETAFAPDDPITREQMAAILYRYAAWKDYDVSASQDLSVYSDASQISAYAQMAMQWTNAEGLITGNTATTLNPQGEATRAEVATILMRFCESIGNGAAA